MTVTEIVRDWIDGLSSNYGFILKDEEEGLTDHWTTWYSSDAPSPHKPELHITYDGPELEEPDPTDPDDGDSEYIPPAPVLLCGIADSYHDHQSAIEYVASLMISRHLMSNEQAILETIEPDEFKEQLAISRIVTTRSHGYIVKRNNTAVVTGLQLKTGITAADAYIITNKEYEVLCDKYAYITDSDVFIQLHLAVFVGCETAAPASDGSNFTKRVVDCGARVAVGFEKEIDCAEANEWTQSFYEYLLLDNCSVATAALNACRGLSVEGNLYNHAIYGNGNYTID
jgi:hypothetical protein